MRDILYAYLRYWDVPTSEEEEEADTPPHQDDDADFAELILVPVPLD